jgi:hypothetical protein
MANCKHFYVSRDPIELIKSSGVPLRLQDIAEMCHGDRRYILRRIESQKRKERDEMREFFYDNELDFKHQYRSMGRFSSDFDDEDDFDDIDGEIDGLISEKGEAYPFPDNIHYLYVRKGFPVQLLMDEDFEAIRKKWVVHGHWRNASPKGYMRLFCTYRVLRQIKSIQKVPRELKSKKGRIYPLVRKVSKKV